MAAYISVSGSPNTISYRAEIVGWQNKLTMSDAARTEAQSRIGKFQPSETDGIYTKNEKGKACVNLISVIRLARLKAPFSVSCLRKTIDGTPVKEASGPRRAIPVHKPPDWLGVLDEELAVNLKNALAAAVSRSALDSITARQGRLAHAAELPVQVQVLSIAFRRNPDVIVEVLRRANGICEECHCPAPFLRASDGTPYLEVHHSQMLARGGKDTVENAVALCPNCHRKLHFGYTNALDQG